MSEEDHLIPVKLPEPPSMPPHEPNSSPLSSLDVHIKWFIDSGAIVQQGERIARLSFYPQGQVQSGNVSKADAALAPRSNIRARMKKRWTNNNAAASAPNSSELVKSNEAPTIQNHGVSIDIRSPVSGFLRNVHSKTTVTNAIQINLNQQPKYSVTDLVLAAVEPCQHPALVGSLCAVCGTDTRASKTVDLTEDDDEVERKREQQQARRILRREHGDTRPEKVSDGNGTQNSSDGASSTNINSVVHQANDSDRAAPTLKDSKSSDTMQSQTNNVKSTASTSSSVRSLSSLLSGAKTTQQMQETQRQYHRPPSRRNVARSAVTAHSKSESNSSDAKMTQMTVSGGVTLTISEAEAKSISEADSKRLKESKQLCLVLDLDHTLLHATDDFRAGRFVAEEIFVDEADENDSNIDNSDSKPHTRTAPNPQFRNDVRTILLPWELPPEQYAHYIQQRNHEQHQYYSQNQISLPPIPDQKLRHFVKLRPHLKEFFDSIQYTYKLSVYTAGTRAYAERIAVMICRHLVGATLDEEGLNALRTRVREKDNESKRYNAWMGRREQLKLAKERDATLESSLPSKNGKGTAKKIVSFSMSSGGDSKDVSTNAAKVVDSTASKVEKPQPLPTEECSPPGEADNTPKNDEELLAQKVNGSLNVSPGKAVNNPSESILKRNLSQSEAKSDGQIPRKKRKVESDSLISLMAPPPPKNGKDGAEKKEEELKDPREERDKLRMHLDEAERLEVEATSLRRKLFGSRIVSRTDVGDLGTDVKSLKRVFPCGGVMAAIVDDREDVWANAKNNDTGRPGEPPDNLLLVQPYHWKPFSGYRDVNNASGVDLSKSDDDKGANKESDTEETDVQLLWIADILKRLHERFYSPSLSEKERDQSSVPSLLRSMRRETLSRSPEANIVFSGVIPIQQQNVKTDVRLPLVRYAEELGAKILPDVNEKVTHVVAKRDHSDKIKRAREIPGCYIVHPAWLMECYWSITLRDVEPHHMGPMPKEQRKQEVPSSNVLLGDSEEELEDQDEEDDDFADDLEKEMMTTEE